MGGLRMNVKKWFYDEFLAVQERIRAETAAQNAAITEEARAAQRAQSRAEIASLIERLAQQPVTFRPDKRARFHALARRAVRFAKMVGANISIQTTDRALGVLTLSADRILWKDQASFDFSGLLRDLTAQADNIWVSQQEHNGQLLVQMEFQFLFYEYK